MTKLINPLSTKSLLFVASLLLLVSASPVRAAFLTANGDFGSPQALGNTVAAPWTPNSGGGDSITAGAQSPFTNVFANNGQGVNLPQNQYSYFVQEFTALPYATSSGLVQVNVDFENTSSGSGYYSIEAVKGADGTTTSAAAFINDTNLVVWGSGGLVTVLSDLAQGVWYNLQMTLNLSTHTYGGQVTKFGGATTTFSGLNFVTSGNDISGIYTDQSSSNVPGLPGTPATDPTRNIDNFVLQSVPEPSSVVLLIVGMVSLALYGRRAIRAKA